jgi:tetratricopeptide (TPR) repeat protein
MYDLSSSERLYREGRRFMDAGAWEQAIQRFTASVEAAPHFKTLELLGECFLELGRPKDAVVPLAAAARLNPQPRACWRSRWPGRGVRKTPAPSRRKCWATTRATGWPGASWTGPTREPCAPVNGALHSPASAAGVDSRHALDEIGLDPDVVVRSTGESVHFPAYVEHQMPVLVDLHDPKGLPYAVPKDSLARER